MPQIPRPNAQQPATKWRRALHRFFGKLWVELFIGALIIVSVVLTIVEITSESAATVDPEAFARLELINNLITAFFVVELTLRYVAHPVKRCFFREYWIDILAVLPVLRIFRAARALRLLRLLRMLRLFGFLQRIASHFPYVIRRGATEYLVVTGLLLLTVLFGAGVMLAIEAQDNPDIDTWPEAFWFSVYSLFAGEPIPGAPRSLLGRVVAMFIMFMGVTIFAMLTGTVSAFMVERLRMEGQKVDWEHFSEHLVICGWNSKAEIVIREYRISHPEDDQPVVVIAEPMDEPPSPSPDLRDHVQILEDDFTRVVALEQAGIHRAQTCIILSDTRGERTAQDADARAILAALTVEKLNSNVYTCAELNNRGYGSHLEMGHVNDYVVSGEHSAYLLAQAALNRGITDVFAELLTHERGNQFYRVPITDTWHGRPILDLFLYLKQEHNAILLAVHTADGRHLVNPSQHTFQPGDEVTVIAARSLALSQA